MSLLKEMFFTSARRRVREGCEKLAGTYMCLYGWEVSIKL